MSETEYAVTVRFIVWAETRDDAIRQVEEGFSDDLVADIDSAVERVGDV